MIGGRGMSLVRGRNRPRSRMMECQEAGCSWGWMQQMWIWQWTTRYFLAWYFIVI